VREFDYDGQTFNPGSGTFKTDLKGLRRLGWASRLRASGRTLQYIRYVDDFPVVPLNDRWESVQIGTELTYVVQTGPKVIERCLLMCTDPGDLVLDPTCGSGTTAYVAEQWGRRWITIDTSRVALALARMRLMAARYPYYYLADSCPQMTQMIADEDIKNYLHQSASSADKNSSSSAEGFPPPPDIRKGFVYKRVPHVTLKSIANNPDIKEGMTRAEIDAAIRRHAETETLFDQPYEDKNRIRVSGPFTVESLSPDRIVSTDEERPATELVGQKHPGRADFATMILDNLRKAGVQNTFKNERLKFDRENPVSVSMPRRGIQEDENGGGKR
jgi:adenine-specific DNA-methyltransferase